MLARLLLLLTAALIVRCYYQPELPRYYYTETDEFIDEDLPCTVFPSTNPETGLYEALKNATPGDVVCLEPGVYYNTTADSYHLPPKSNPNNKYITVRVSDLSLLPEKNKRIDPSYAPNLPKIVGNYRIISFQKGASYWRFKGIEFVLAPQTYTVYNGIHIEATTYYGDNDQKSIEDMPHHIIIDQCYIHGEPDRALRRCVTMNGVWNAVVNSYLSDCHEKGADSQAIGGWAGYGPFKIVNNYLEGAGENVLFGGAGSGIADLIPSDIEVRNNYVFKPLSWKGVWTNKNLFELKNAQRAIIDGNIFENNWSDAQTGWGILMQGIPGQDGPQGIVQNITFTNNLILNSENGFAFCSSCLYLDGTPYQSTDPQQPGYVDPTISRTQRLLFKNNLFLNLTGGAILMTGKSEYFSFVHNTFVLQDYDGSHGAGISLAGVPKAELHFDDNILFRGPYGTLVTDGVDNPPAGGISIIMPFYVSSSSWSYFNGHIGYELPEADRSLVLNNVSSVSFDDQFLLRDDSPWKGQASDGLDLGIGMELWESIKNTRSGLPNLPAPEPVVESPVSSVSPLSDRVPVSVPQSAKSTATLNLQFDRLLVSLFLASFMALIC